MTVEQLIERLALSVFTKADTQRQITGGYTGDLLSWVMSKAQKDQAWITIMSNVNVVAVAALTDVSCIILAEGVQPDAGVAETAQQRNITLLGSPLSSFALCCQLKECL